MMHAGRKAKAYKSRRVQAGGFCIQGARKSQSLTSFKMHIHKTCQTKVHPPTMEKKKKLCTHKWMRTELKNSSRGDCSWQQFHENSYLFPMPGWCSVLPSSLPSMCSVNGLHILNKSCDGGGGAVRRAKGSHLDQRWENRGEGNNLWANQLGDFFRWITSLESMQSTP